MARIDILAKRLAAEIDSVIDQHLGKISNPVIRRAIEDSLRDQVYDNIGDALSGNIEKIVKDSMNDIVSSIQGTPAKRKGSSLARRASNSFGGKDDSGSKSSNQNIPSPRRDYGGKNGYGGK